MEETRVLIVGAGPTGLMLGCQLARHGVKFRLVDPKSGPTLQSRAMVVQARSMEVYDQLGLAEECLESAEKMLGLTVYTEGVERLTFDIGKFGEGQTNFAKVVVLEQSENERILVDALRRLGGDVEWGVKFQGMQIDDDKCVAQLIKVDDDTVETASFDWVVGCDGARSPVRHALGMSFEGGTYASTFYLADVDVAGDLLSREYGSIFLAKVGFGLAFPMRGGTGKRFRLIGVVPSEAAEQPGWLQNPDFSVVAEAFRTVSNLDIKLGEPVWFSSYSVHHRKVESFRRGRVLLAGDAAHVHSPAGGQGMNTGLLDAHNLGWKLALVARGLANPDLLDTYDKEREAFARTLLSTTDTAFGVGSSSNPWAAIFRLRILPLLMRPALSLPFLGRAAYRRISQIALAYPESTLSHSAARGGSLHAGHRFPPCLLRSDNGTIDASVLLRERGFCILDFSPTRGDDAAQVVKDIGARSGLPLYYHACELPQTGENPAGVAELVYVVRPDMYLGLVDESLTTDKLQSYLRQCVSVKL